MSDWGVFAVSRGIWTDPDFAPEPFTEREAWMWLVSAAVWKRTHVGFNGSVIPLERGEFCFALRFLAEKFRWSKSRVERFLDKLKKRDIIRDDKRDKVHVYKVRNYNRYQRVGLPKQDAERDNIRDESGTSPGRVRDKEETFKHSNIEEEEPVLEAKASSADAVVPAPAMPVTAANGVGDKPEWWPGRDRYGRVIGEVSNKLVYDVGKAVLGSNSAALVTKLKRCDGMDLRHVMELLLEAEEASTPRAWFAVVLKRCETEERPWSKDEIYLRSEYA